MAVSNLIWIGLVLLTTALLFLLQKKNRKFPPGPKGLPFLGYYPFLGKHPHEVVAKLGQNYGNVIGFYIGLQYVVVLNDWDAMTDAYNQSQTLDRPSSVFAGTPYNLGVAGASRPDWTYLRRLMARALKDVGMHQTRWEELVQEEIEEVIQSITQHHGEPLDVRTFFSETFANNVLTLAFGERLKAGHPLIKVVARSVDLIMEHNSTFDMSNFSSKMQKILKLFGIGKKLDLSEQIQEFTKFVTKAVDEKICKFEKESDDSFVTRLHQELETHGRTQIPFQNSKDYILKGNVAVLLAGGSETSRTTLIFALMALADHPEVQRKVQEELDSEFGQGESVKWSDRGRIPYTYATLLESMRWRTVVPISTLRAASENMQVQGYDIPKGTFLTFNMWALHNDPKYWDQPEKFIPERFLLNGGRKVNTEAKSFSPFSYGKRNCVGMLVAQMEIIQYFTALTQNFTIVPDEGNKVQYDVLMGLTYQATNVRLRFIPRH